MRAVECLSYASLQHQPSAVRDNFSLEMEFANVNKRLAPTTTQSDTTSKVKGNISAKRVKYTVVLAG